MYARKLTWNVAPHDAIEEIRVLPCAYLENRKTKAASQGWSRWSILNRRACAHWLSSSHRAERGAVETTDRLRDLPPAVLAGALLALNLQTLISQYAADHWRTADGLPQASVLAIAQTTDGYIWLATAEGLVRFDGVRFAVFDTTNSALTDNSISNLLAGRDGSLWIRTAATLYRSAAGEIRAVCSGRSMGLNFTPMLEDRSGAIWSRDTDGLMVYSARGDCRHHAFDAERNDVSVTSFIESSDGGILLGTNGGVKQFAHGTIEEVPA
jgi:ligand-binding sensor domain-containing protein